MPLPEAAENLVDRLAGAYRAVQADLIDELVDAVSTADPYGRVAVRRARLREQLRALEAGLDQLEAGTREWMTGDFPEVYRLGATQGGLDFTWTAEHREAVAMLANDTFDDLLAATRHVRRETKAFIREAAQIRTRASALGGRTAVQQGRALASDLAERGISAVTYKNGARHPLGEYGSMVVRTKSALAYNTGTFQNGSAHGVDWYECYDGPDCGLTYHDDPELANGLIVKAEVAFAWPISHPNCARSWGPRPDVRTAQEAEAARRYSPEEQQEMAAAERARAATRGPIVRTRPDRERRREQIRRRRARRLAAR